MLTWLASLVAAPWLAPVIAIARKVPWWFYAAAGIALAFWLWLGHHDRALVAATEARVNGVWEKREKDAADRQAAAVNHLRGEIADWVLQGLAWRDELSAKLRTATDQRIAAFETLDKERAARVTPEANRRCDLTRGVILQFNAGARAANGVADVAADADAGSVLNDTPAGVSLDRFARAAEDTQASLGVCREQVFGWNAYCGPGGVLEKWYEGIREKANRCFPQLPPTKGTP